ncbi:MAG: hypothetical protein J5787_05765 [Alphaproteobacteria bacterium]|nr:hypothetical protein [Alphaproteobacteria bacterium]
MKNTIFLNSDFGFTLLECEENTLDGIWLQFHTNEETSQVLHVTANGETITEALASDTDILYELNQAQWVDGGDTEIYLSNSGATSDTITITFSALPVTSFALNRVSNTEFVVQFQGQEEAGSGGSGSGNAGGSSFDFVETIRNIGYRLLDEPTYVSAAFNARTLNVELKWTDPADINTLEPVPCAWAGTVVVRKPDAAPKHRWDGVIVKDSTTRNQYASVALQDSTILPNKTYFYGIFPYHIGLDDLDNPIKHYRYTKVVKVQTGEAETVQVLLKTSEELVTDLIQDLIYFTGESWTPKWKIGDTGTLHPELDYTLNVNTGTASLCFLNNPFGKSEATKMYIDIECANSSVYGMAPRLACGIAKRKGTSESDSWYVIYNDAWTTYQFVHDVPAGSGGFPRTRIEISLDAVEGDFYIGFAAQNIHDVIIREVSFDAPVIVKGG